MTFPFSIGFFFTFWHLFCSKMVLSKWPVIGIFFCYQDSKRGLWEISIRSPLREQSQRSHRTVSTVMTFSNRCLKCTSKKMFFCDALKAFQIYLKKAWDEFHFYLSRKYCRTLASLQFILTSFVKVIIFGFCFWKHILNSVTVNKWKSERRISKTVL